MVFLQVNTKINYSVGFMVSTRSEVQTRSVFSILYCLVSIHVHWHYTLTVYLN